MFESVNRQGTHTVKWDDAKKKFGTDELLPMWVADMDLASPLCVQKSIRKRAEQQLYGYTIYPERYFKAIQDWMAKRFDWKIEKEWIVPCYGVVPSLNFIISACSEEGDGIIVQTPIYPPFVSSVKHKGRRVLDNRLVYENGRYHIDFQDLETKAKEAKLFLLCSPHNPTGRVWSMEELEKIIDICVENDVLIISDEIHADIVYEKRHHCISSFEKMKHKSIVLNAPSKTFNVAGLNTSYAIIPDSRLRQAYELEQNRSGITNGNPFGIEALISAYEEGGPWLEQLKVHLMSNITYVKIFLQEHNIPIDVVPTEATFLIWLDCRKMGLSQSDLVDFFVYKAKLGLNDGESFGHAGEGFMRLNVGTSKEVVKEAMQRLHDAYKAGY
ncbi:MAG: putative C-S lyase [Epsilonproteobacteria bacterium]|nr:MAG: putative C-S lyase [Campylobacterota bacterium]